MLSRPVLDQVWRETPWGRIGITICSTFVVLRYRHLRIYAGKVNRDEKRFEIQKTSKIIGKEKLPDGRVWQNAVFRFLKTKPCDQGFI